MKYQIINGNNIDVLKTFPDNHFDSIVTDPPYGIDFLGKSWDANTGALETYQECLRVLKPGGHILAFSAARTYHHLAITLEQAGFEIRDQIMWIYSSGFPKSQDVGKSIDRSAKKDTKTISRKKDNESMFGIHGVECPKCHSKDNNQKLLCKEGNECGMIYKPQTKEAKQWEGWGTALKPAHEPIALARKPIKQSIAKNCQKYGVGALNIDATRIPMEQAEAEAYMEWMRKYPASTGNRSTFNNILSESQNKERIPDALSEINPDRDALIESRAAGRFPSNVIGEISEPYQKYFYCPKVSRRERHAGFELPPPMFGNVEGAYGPDGERFAVGFDARAEGKTKKKKHDPLAHIPTDPSGKFDRTEDQKLNANERIESKAGNNHPTVKPVELMKYLIKLVTPANGKVLDPFNGSGSTGMAAVELGHEYVGIELDPAYVEIAKKRIEAWNKQDTTFGEIFE
jgi:DNA modification methylase